jgi:hypothetical protein
MPPTTKKRLKICVAVLFLAAFVGLFIFTPGWLLGGVRVLTADSHVSVRIVTHERVPLPDTQVAGFHSTGWEEFHLDGEQTAQLARLMRRSWFTRRSQGALTYRLPQDEDRFYTYHIHIGSTHPPDVTLSLHFGGNVTRSTAISNWRNNNLRIHNPRWEETLREILRGSP